MSTHDDEATDPSVSGPGETGRSGSSSPREGEGPRTWLLGVALGTTLAALSLAYAYAHLSATREIPSASVSRLVLGTASTPFQYRVLVPFLIGRVIRLVPALNTEAVTLLVALEALFHFATVAVSIAYFRGRGASLLDAALRSSLVAALPFFYFVLPPFRAYFFPSDTASLFFVVSILVAASSGRWGWFFVLVLVGTFNRETTLLALAAVVVASRQQALAPPARRLVLASAFGYAAVKASLLLAFAGNDGAGLLEVAHDVAPGQPMVSHLETNLALFASPRTAAYVLGLAIGPVLVALSFAGRLEDRLQSGYACVLPVYTLVLFVVGNLDELRIFGDVVPPLALAFAGSGLRAPSRTVPSPRTR